MSTSVLIGKWVEKESRDITQCPSYYAADYEVLRTRVGEYPVRLTFQGGYIIPMPYWVLVGIDADRIEGKIYSGFGGVNYSSRDLPVGPKQYHIQAYQYHLTDMVKQGLIQLDSGFEWLITEGDTPCWKNPKSPKTWEEVRALVAATERRAA